MAYTTTSKCYTVTGLSSDDVSSDNMTIFITWADALINAQTGYSYDSATDISVVKDISTLYEYNSARYITGELAIKDEYNYFFMENSPINYVSHTYLLVDSPVYSRVWSYDSSGTSYTDNTSEANAPAGDLFYAFATSVGIGDILYFGSEYKFTGVVLNLNTVGVGGVVVWEYYNGSAWTTISVTEVGSGADDLNASGIVYWTLPTDFSKATVNSIETYYMRARVTTAHSTSPTVDYLSFKQDCVISEEISVGDFKYDERSIKINKSYLISGIQKIKFEFNYGSSTVPSIVEQLSSIVAGISALGSLIGSTYDDITSGSLGDEQWATGEQYFNIKNAIMELKKKEDILWSLVDKKPLYGDV